MHSVKSDKRLEESATKAYKSFLTSYDSLQANCFSNRTFALTELCKIFGLEKPPQYDFNMSKNKRKNSKVIIDEKISNKEIDSFKKMKNKKKKKLKRLNQ